MRGVSRLFLIADITRRLKAPDPTIRLGPSSSCLKSLKIMPTMLSRISGADLGKNIKGTLFWWIKNRALQHVS